MYDEQLTQTTGGTVTDFNQVLAGMTSMQRRGLGPSGNREAPDRLERWLEIVDRARAQVEDLLKGEFAIKTDSRLSVEGKAEKLRELAQVATDEFRWIGREIDQIHEAQARLNALCLDYLIVPKDADKQVQYWREMEIRQGLRHQPEHARQMAFLKAAEQLDGETMRAIQAGPGGPWIAGETLQRAEEIYGQRRNPEAWKNLKSLSVYLDHVLAVANHIAIALLSWRAEPIAIQKALGVVIAPEEPVKEPARG